MFILYLACSESGQYLSFRMNKHEVEGKYLLVWFSQQSCGSQK